MTRVVDSFIFLELTNYYASIDFNPSAVEPSPSRFTEALWHFGVDCDGQAGFSSERMKVFVRIFGFARVMTSSENVAPAAALKIKGAFRESA